MNKDAVKIIVAVALLLIAGVIIVIQFGGGGNSGPSGGERVDNFELPEDYEPNPMTPFIPAPNN